MSHKNSPGKPAAGGANISKPSAPFKGATSLPTKKAPMPSAKAMDPETTGVATRPGRSSRKGI